MLLNRALYALFVALLATSPIVSVGLSAIFLGKLSLWSFLWVGVALSLPVTLVAAKAFGEGTYIGYWAYLETFRGNSKTLIITLWATVTAAAVLIGVGSIWDGK